MNMSHDIRTPMNTIIGILNIMEHEEGVPEHLYKYIHRFQLSSNYLLGLINNVLDMSKIESGEVSLTDGKISLADQVAQIDSVVRPQAYEHRDIFRMFAIAGENTPAVSINVGVAFTDRENPVKTLFTDADLALYYTKVHGRNGCTFYPVP